MFWGIISAQDPCHPFLKMDGLVFVFVVPQVSAFLRVGEEGQDLWSRIQNDLLFVKYFWCVLYRVRCKFWITLTFGAGSFFVLGEHPMHRRCSGAPVHCIHCLQVTFILYTHPHPWRMWNTAILANCALEASSPLVYKSTEAEALTICGITNIQDAVVLLSLCWNYF